MVYFALVDTLFKSKVILLPNLAFLGFRRAFELVFVPFISSFTLRLNTGQQSFLIIERPLRRTRAGIVLSVISLVNLALIRAFLS